MPEHPTLVLIRHGQSEWNLQDRFTGWTDVDLTPQGREEARQAGVQLARAQDDVDICFTSVLKRAIRTSWIVLEAMDRMWLPVVTDWRLNERHYGALQGLNKAETAAKYGADQVRRWRRSYADRPPTITRDDPRFPAAEPAYASVPRDDLPVGESLADTGARVLPYWQGRIVPELQRGRRVLIVAHGNSLRALVKHLQGISDVGIEDVDIPTGLPVAFRLDAGMKVTERIELTS